MKITLAVLCMAAYALALWSVASLIDRRDKDGDKLVKVEASGWTWCGSQRFVHYKSSSISIDAKNGWVTYYGPVVVRDVATCEKPSEPK